MRLQAERLTKWDFPFSINELAFEFQVRQVLLNKTTFEIAPYRFGVEPVTENFAVFPAVSSENRNRPGIGIGFRCVLVQGPAMLDNHFLNLHC